jgi:Flp pilus assembly protein TadG
VAAVEFAIILPVMMFLYIGTFEVTQAIRVDGKVARIADTVGNLITRLKTIDTTSLTNIFAISSAIMNPFDDARLTMTVTAVKVDANGKATVKWAKANRGSAAAIGAAYVVPVELVGLNDTYFVVTKASYDYQPLFGLSGIVGDMTFLHEAQFRPRKSTEVTWK